MKDMKKILFLLAVIILSSYAASQMTTESGTTAFNLSYILDGFNKTKDLSLNMSERNRWCQQMFECRPHESFFYYDCYFDLNISNCRCLVGMFSRCNLEASNLSIIAKPVSRPLIQIQDIKRVIKPVMPLLSSAKRALYDWRTIVFGVLAFLIIIVIIYAYNRDTPSNNVRRARAYHKKAQALYEKGKPGDADKYYRLAEELRKKIKEL